MVAESSGSVCSCGGITAGGTGGCKSGGNDASRAWLDGANESGKCGHGGGAVVAGGNDASAADGAAKTAGASAAVIEVAGACAAAAEVDGASLSAAEEAAGAGRIAGVAERDARTEDEPSKTPGTANGEGWLNWLAGAAEEAAG